MLTCAETPCFHAGTCRETDGGRGYRCECPAGYTGLNCEKKLDRCTSLRCANGNAPPAPRPSPSRAPVNPFCSRAGGHCVTSGALWACSCRSGFAGPRCETNVDECAAGPCAAGATCVDRINDYSCVCPPGSAGRRCDRPAEPCAARPCQNGGACAVGVGGQPVCTCPPGYGGLRCQADAPGDGLSWAAVGLGAGAVLALLCGAAAAMRHVGKRRSDRRDSEEMNNVSKADFQKENLISTSELKNTNKKMDVEVDRPSNKSNQKRLNHYQLDYKSWDELSVPDKEENCDKALDKAKPVSRTYR